LLFIGPLAISLLNSPAKARAQDPTDPNQNNPSHNPPNPDEYIPNQQKPYRRNQNHYQQPGNPNPHQPAQRRANSGENASHLKNRSMSAQNATANRHEMKAKRFRTMGRTSARLRAEKAHSHHRRTMHRTTGSKPEPNAKNPGA
jgi:hypothetical protein